MGRYTDDGARQILESNLALLKQLLETLAQMRARALRDGHAPRVKQTDQSIDRVESQIRRILRDLKDDPS